MTDLRPAATHGTFAADRLDPRLTFFREPHRSPCPDGQPGLPMIDRYGQR